MKRRNFIRRVGLGSGGLFIANNLRPASFHGFSGPKFNVSNYEDLVTDDGDVMIRLTYSSTDPQQIARHSGKIRVKKGTIKKTRDYFFHNGMDDLDPAMPGLDVTSYPGYADIVVLWISDGSAASEVSIPVGNKIEKFTIAGLIEAGDLVFEHDTASVSASYLLDREIGEIDPSDIGIREQGDQFRFTAMADPQGGNPFAHGKVHTRMRIHNAFIDESVRVANELDPQPVFNIVIGDIVDGQGHHEDFRSMNDMLSRVKAPTFYEIGNHETKYRSVFTPGYNMADFQNYFTAQKEFNGLEKLLYSFNLGKWHFIVWPDPLRSNFWETHPHYFAWLEADLEKYKERPTMLFQHVPAHPIGILPLINYAESVDVKRTLLETLAKHGNVKYILSGHVHIPMKASVKTSASYMGIQMINLPAAGYRPRAFGEEDYNGGPSQGVAVIDIKDDDAVIRFKTVTNEEFTYPEAAPLNTEKYPLWLNHKWELANSQRLQNGDFSNDLQHWHRRYVYTEDVHPSNICESRVDEEGNTFLYLYNRNRGYNAPGQDRLPQSINRICQAVKQQAGTIPHIKLSYRIDPDHYIEENLAGSFIWIEGFEKGLKRLNVVYSTDYVHWHLGGAQSQLRTVMPVHLDISAKPGVWRELELNPVGDFIKFTEDPNPKIWNMDVLAINFGVWTINEGFRREAAASFKKVDLQFHDIGRLDDRESKNMGVVIPKKDQKYLWWHGIQHPAGEHQSIVEDLNKYL